MKESKMKRILLGMLLAAGLFNQLVAQDSNTLIVGNASVYEFQDFHLSLMVDNDNEFSAVQLDLLLPESVSYIEGSAMLTDRADDHVFSASTINNTLRIIIYSMTMSSFFGNSGSIMEMDFSQSLGTNFSRKSLSFLNQPQN